MAKKKVKSLHTMSSLELAKEAERILKQCNKSIAQIEVDVSKLARLFKTHVVLVKRNE